MTLFLGIDEGGTGCRAALAGSRDVAAQVVSAAADGVGRLHATRLLAQDRIKAGIVAAFSTGSAFARLPNRQMRRVGGHGFVPGNPCATIDGTRWPALCKTFPT